MCTAVEVRLCPVRSELLRSGNAHSDLECWEEGRKGRRTKEKVTLIKSRDKRLAGGEQVQFFQKMELVFHLCTGHGFGISKSSAEIAAD